MPLAIIVSKAFRDKWVTWQREITKLSPDSSFTFTGTKSHNIHLRHPELVTAAVTKVAPQGGA